MPTPRTDRFRFQFWLSWIFGFAGSFLLASFTWTAAIQGVFSAVRGPELTALWALSVFGSWFLLLIPFMRKKERIWKRLNTDQEKALDLYLKAMGLFIGLLIASTFLWSYALRDRLNLSGGFDREWMKCVFGTWLVMMLPFLAFFYRRADQIFKDAVVRQSEPAQPLFRSHMIEKIQRILPEPVAAKLLDAPPAIREGHIVNLVLRDGRRVANVFVMNNREILGIYDRESFDFKASDVADLETVALQDLPAYEESKWLRLDGRV